MARFRRMGAMRPVNRIKHVIDASGTLAAATVLSQALIVATDTPTLADTDGVETGARVNGIYLKVEVASNEVLLAGIPNVYMMVWKNPGGNLVAGGIPSPNAVGASDNKRFVFHQEMVMINKADGGNPRVLFNGVIAIPKGYRRMGPNDEIKINFISPVVDITFCIQAHYKEFR